ADAARTGGWPGISKGAISSEAAGAVNISYDTQVTMEEDAGHWNNTVYGTRFIRICKMHGAGPVQIGPGLGLAGTVPGYNTNVGRAWSGPNCAPGIFGS